MRRHVFIRFSSNLLCGIMAVGLSAPVLAQTNLPEPNEAAVGEETDEANSGDIVVTAQRREQRLQNVPLSMAAVGAESLERMGVTNSADLTRITPGLVFSANGANPQPAIRGVVTTGVSPGDSANVALYVDGVYISSQIGGYSDFNNIARIEVLKGPQGSLYGRNATGGAIIVVTRDPSERFSTEGSLSAGSYGRMAAQFYATGGLAEGVAMDIAANYTEDDGYVRDIVSRRRLKSANNYGVRSKLRFDPTDSLSFTLAGDYSRYFTSTAFAGVPVAGNTSAVRTAGAVIGRKRGEVALSFVPYVQDDSYGVSLKGEWEIGPATITSITAHRWNDSDSLVDTDISNLNLTSTRLVAPVKTFTQEVYAASAGSGPFQWLVGAFYIDDHAERTTGLSLTNGIGPNVTVKAKSSAFSPYAELTYNLGEHFVLIGGARYNHEKRGAENFSNGVPRLSCTPSTPPAPATICAKATFNDVTYRLTAQYKVDDNLNFYVTNSTGFKSGVFNSSAFDGTPVKPETISAWAVGSKGRVGGINFSAEAFHYDYKNLQVVRSLDPTTGTTQLQNAANARIRGAELALDGRLIGGLSFNFGIAYLDAKYQNFPLASIVTVQPPAFCAARRAPFPCGNVNATLDASGKDLIRAPKWSGNAGLSFETGLLGGTFRTSGSLYFTSKYFWDVANRLQQPSYETLRLDASWAPASERVSVSVWADNVTDKVYFAFVNTNSTGDRGTYAAPRRFGVKLGWKFD